MARAEVGTVQSKHGRPFTVEWDNDTKDVFVIEFGSFFDTTIPCNVKADSSANALQVATAFVADRKG
ncbi:MAG: hypothetical protein U1E97_03645 [Alphaproteobacteria bacterium]